jgi:hypothetical protein
MYDGALFALLVGPRYGLAACTLLTWAPNQKHFEGLRTVVKLIYIQTIVRVPGVLVENIDFSCGHLYPTEAKS